MLFLLPDVVKAAEYILVPIAGEPGQYMSVWRDGSYSRWVPTHKG